ncbi:hypothetical protein TYRP_018970 [Tyrophagus putrescentiae]|nr:hypothetical protein TYRP_018970 [Tyrophagus putrescentiae]
MAKRGKEERPEQRLTELSQHNHPKLAVGVLCLHAVTRMLPERNHSPSTPNTAAAAGQVS